MNVGHHCRILNVGDCSKAEIHQYFKEYLLPTIPDQMRASVDFEYWYGYFGGKLGHWSDSIADYINSDGQMALTETSHFIQAYTLLRIHLSHADHFNTYSPFPKQVVGTAVSSDDNVSFTKDILLEVMKELVKKGHGIYFELCDKLGSDAIDSIIRTRIIELRWSRTITTEGVPRDNPSESIEVEKPKLVAMTPVLLKAMNVVLVEENLL